MLRWAAREKERRGEGSTAIYRGRGGEERAPGGEEGGGGSITILMAGVTEGERVGDRKGKGCGFRRRGGEEALGQFDR
jgi:hypothetical protein